MNNNLKRISFDDIIGYEKEKMELKEIQNFIVNLKKYEEIGARIPKGILLVGESGNGKTLMAKALSQEINIPFYSIGDELNEDTTVKSIREVFIEARNNSPCIIFIDEIDKLDSSSDFMDPLVNDGSPLIRELLTQMDGFQKNCGIIVIATANSTMSLNKSLLRSGRFDRMIEIRMPNKKERKLLFEHYAKNKIISDDVDFDKLAIRTPGICCADVDNILNDAALMAIRDNQESISTKYIEDAIDRVMFGSAIANKLSDDARKKIAIHEVGHALVAIKLGQRNDLNKISITSRGQSLGFTRFSRNDEVEQYGFTSRSKMIDNIIVSYGGIAAEEVILHDITTSCMQDLFTARNTATVMVKRFGMLGVTNSVDVGFSSLDNGFSQKKKRKVEKLLDGILENAYKEAIKLIKDNMDLFNRIYDRLLESNVLYKEEIDEIVGA